MAIDLVGYSALSEIDEAEAIAAVAQLRAALDRAAGQHGGRIFNTAGDGFMMEFDSAAGALAAAELLWLGVERARVRVGLHVGDVMVAANGDLLGHSVNVASRLQQLAQPGAVLVSLDARRAVRGKLAQRLHAAGSAHLDKMAETIEIFSLEAEAAPRKRGGKRTEAVLAVLPFDNESDDAEMHYFSDGVADEIILTLLRHSNLKVIGRTSAFQFRGERKTEAAGALRATHVLDGAVRCSGLRLRVGAQLIDAESGMALWSERYEGDRADAFALEDAIAGKVAAALRLSLSYSERAAPIDPAAYELYLRARQIWLLLSDIEEEHAETLLERCVALAPDFAPGWAALASVRAFLLPRDRDTIGEPKHAGAVTAALRALELDPDCSQALAALSLLKPAFAEHGEKLRLVNEALARTPNDSALHVARATWLYGVGRIREAAATLEVASRLDPLGPAIEGLRASLLTTRGDVATALDVIGPAWARWPDSAFIWYMMLVTLWAGGRYDEAEALTAPGVPPKRGVTQTDVAALREQIVLLRLPEAERREAAAATLADLARTSGPLPLSKCLVAAGVGCADQAFDVIDAALDQERPLRPDMHDAFGMARAQAPLQLFVSNGGEPIWKHARFARLAARLGLAQYWLETKKWPDCATQVGYDFKAACAEAAGGS
jgi:TolB-like protein